MIIKVGVGGEAGQTKKLLETEYNMKELFHFINQYHWLPEEPSVKGMVRVTNVDAVSLVLNAAGM